MGETLTTPAGQSVAEGYKATRLSTSDIVQLWPQVVEQLMCIPHIWTGRWTLDALYTLSINSRFQLWAFGPEEELRVIVFTQIIEYPASRVVQAFLCFGNSLDDALPIIEATLERFCIENECKTFELVGRRAWERKLKGFTLDCVVLTKAVKSQGVH